MFTRKDFLTGGVALAAAGAFGEKAKGKAALATPDVVFKDLQTVKTLSGGGRVYALSSRIDSISLSTVFVSPEGKILVVDGGNLARGGDGRFLGDFLRKLGGHVDYWFITHAHGDHYGALADIVKRPDCGGLKIGRVVHNFLPLDFIAATEKASIPYVTPFLEDLGKSGLRVEKPVVGQTFDLGEGLAFECLNDYDLSMRNNSINNSSICYRVTNGGKSILVTGDIGVEMGDKLLKIQPPEKIKSDVVFLSHHGQCGANKNFYAAVKPEICVWPTPQWLWDNNIGGGVGSGPWRTNFTKCWMQELGVKRQILLTKDAALGPI
jgi:hypothetical protein